MIFSIGDHIPQIINRKKTQTRRKSGKYKVGSLISIQPKYGKPGILVGKIKIVKKIIERRSKRISIKDARAEGGYKPKQFEALYAKIYPKWKKRYAYTFEFVPDSYLKLCDKCGSTIPKDIKSCWVCGSSERWPNG